MGSGWINSKTGIVLRKTVTIDRIVIGTSGYTSILDYYPGAQAGYMFLHAYLSNYNSSTIKTAFAITGNGDYIYGTPDTAISNVAVAYLYVPTVLT